MTRILMTASMIGDDSMNVTHALVDIGAEWVRKVDAITHTENSMSFPNRHAG